MHRIVFRTLMFVGLVLLQGEGAIAQQLAGKDQIQGGWTLTNALFTDFGGNTLTSKFGEKPAGYLAVTPDGRAIILIVNSASSKTPTTNDIAGVVLKSMIAWSGKYEVNPATSPDGNKITFKVDASVDPTLTGVPQAFTFKIDGTQLVLTSVPPAGTRVPTMTLTFQKSQ